MMIKKLSLFATAIVLLGTGCKTNFDINASQEDLTSGSLNYRDVLPAAITNTAKIVAADWKFLQNWMGYWARSGSYQGDTQEESYIFTNSFPAANNPWTDLYYNNSNYNYVQKRAVESGDRFYEAICIIMKSHNFQLLTDVYGNIPYSDALKGNESRSPKYDNGVDIYKDIFRKLDDAIAILKDPAAISPSKNEKIATNDLIFKGDASMWIKFANTLKLRLLVHAYEVPEINADDEMNIINAEGSGFLGAGQSAKLNPGYSASKPNPFYRVYAINENGVLAGNADFVKANAYAVGYGDVSNPRLWGYYRYDGDPRVDKFYVKPDVNPSSGSYVPAAEHKGIPYGAISGLTLTGIPGTFSGIELSSINAINNTSPNTGLTPNGPSSDAWIITSVESLFLQAEARERNIIKSGPTAKELLTSAIEESFVYLGLTKQDAADYLDFNAGYPDVDYDEGTDKVFTILSQKWFALNGIAPYEIWTDYRRTDITYGQVVGYFAGPPLSILDGAATTIPVRLFYPQSEYSFNAANVGAQGDIDVFTSRVFWDKK